MKEEDAPASAPAQRDSKKRPSSIYHAHHYKCRVFFLLALSQFINNRTLKKVSHGHKI